MNRHRVALDDGLSYYRSLLLNEGYEVTGLDGGTADAEAILLSGQDDNLTGDTTRLSPAFIIDVDGRQPEEVLYDLRKHFNLKGDGPLEPF